jgi:hypothetical protein
MVFRFPARFRLLASVALVTALTAASAVPAAATTARWPRAERYALKLTNCTRTGGWVLKDGTCVDYGSGKHSPYRKPLAFNQHLAAYVSRPQAQRVAQAGYLDHNLGGSILSRFKKAGVTCCAMGESLGHWNGSLRASILADHLMVQAEKSTNGWHWRNLKNRQFKVVGIGVWRLGRDVYTAWDFWDGHN